jgi:Ca2+-binding EF-hand superfamily protein
LYWIKWIYHPKALSRSIFHCSTGHSYTDVEVDAIMNLGDTDGDGEIDLQARIKNDI